MNTSEYSEKALRTESPTAGALERLESPELARLLHSVLGIVSEFSELLDATDRTNQIEEVGDLYWFLNLGFDVVGRKTVERPQPSLSTEEPHDPELVNALPLVGLNVATWLADIIKARIFYGKETFYAFEDVNKTKPQTFHEACEAELVGILEVTNTYCVEYLKILPETVMELNIAKLSTRYPDKYTDTQELNRDKYAEITALNGNAGH